MGRKEHSWIKQLLLLLVMLLLVVLSACEGSGLSKFVDDATANISKNNSDTTNNDSTTETERSSFFVDIEPGQSVEKENDNFSESDEFEESGSLDDLSVDMLIECISTELVNFSDEIDITPCLTGYRIEEARVDELINRVVKAFEYNYIQDPFVFYLNGAMKVGYELQSGWGSRYITGMTLSLQRFDRYANTDISELEQIKVDMLSEAQAIVELAGSERSDWEKLLIAHDELVRRINYDTTLNQENNQAASALLDNYSLCKGYAQSFKLVCDLMSIECEIISGQADGIEHAWNLVELDDKVFHVDVTHDDPVPDRGTKSPVDHRHFLRSDTMMSTTHKWIREKYQAAEEDGAHYYRQNDLTASDLDVLKEKIDKFLKISDFDDERNDQLELLYEGDHVVERSELDAMFKDALANSSLNRRFSYQASVDKNVLQLIIMAE